MQLSEENKKQFYIPEGLAHGLLVLFDIAEVFYKCTDFYHPNDEGGIAWKDSEIGIEWPQVVGSYSGRISTNGCALVDGNLLVISYKSQK